MKGGAIAPTIHLSELLRQPDFVWIFNKMYKSHELDRVLRRHVPPSAFWGHRFLAERKDIPLYERLRLLFQRIFIVNDVLHKASAGHEAASVQLLCPYYDRDLYDYVQFLPTRYKTRFGKGKYLHKRLLARHMPEEIFHRPKRGFRIGYDEFGPDLLRGLTDRHLTRKTLGETGLIDVDYALACVEEFYRGNARMGSPLWALLVFELWRKSRCGVSRVEPAASIRE